MLLFWRKLLFYLLLVVYFIITPYAILYALGYLLAPASSGEFFNKTGLLSVVTEPKGARIFVEGKKFSSRTPAAVRDLLPGEYSIQISKKGFENWKKKIGIFQGWATRLEPVILLPLKPEEETISEKAFTALLPLLSDFKVFGLQNNFLESLTGLEIFLKREFPAGQKALGPQSIPVLNFYTKPGSPLVIFKTGSELAAGWFAIHLGREKDARDLSSQIPPDIDFLDWDAKSSELIYFLKKGNVGMANWRKGEVFPKIAQDILGMGVKHNRLYLLKNDFSLWSTGPKGENPRPELAEEGGLQKLADLHPLGRWFRIEILKRDFFQKDLMLFLSDQGALLSDWPPYVLAGRGVKGFQYATHSDGEKVLFWTPRELCVLDFAKESEGAYQKSPVRLTLTREGRDIRQAFWSYDDTHILFRDEDSLFLAEAKPPLPCLVRFVGRTVPDSPVFYHDLTHTLYYLHPQTRRLMRRKVTD